MGVVRDFWNRMFGSPPSPRAADWTPISPRSSGWWRENFQNAAGVTVTADSAMNCGTAIACTRAISETLASLPAMVMRREGEGVKRRATDHPLWSLLHDKPNPQMDSMSWYQINATRVINRGNSLNMIEFSGRGLPIALWPVHNSRFRIFRNRAEQMGNGRFFPGDIFYRIWPDETERHFDVPAGEVLNIVGWDSDDGLIGRGIVSRTKQEIGLDVAQQEFASSMFNNGALPLGLIKHPWLQDVEQREALRADLNTLHTGRENWNKIGILWDKDADWVKLNFSPEDVQAIQSRQFTAKAICRYYGVPPAIVQIFEDYKFATVESMLKHFIMLTIRPYAERFERAINTQVITRVDENLSLEFAFDNLLRGDPRAQAETNSIYRNAGVISADEIRQRDLGLNPLPDGLGEVVLAPLNQAPLELIADGQNMRSQPASDPPPGNTQDDGLAVRVLEDAYFRMVRNEVNGVRRIAAAGADGFLDRVDAFYERFAGSFAKAVGLGCRELGLDPEGLAESHIEDSRQRILAACECPPDQLSDRIAEETEDWTERVTTTLRGGG